MKKRIFSLIAIQCVAIGMYAQDWVQLNSGVSKDIESVFFVSENEGWIIGEDGMVRKTTNGGSSWTAQTVNTTKDLYSIHFVNSQIGWICGKDGRIFHTVNGGTNWSQQFTSTSSDLNDIFFYNADFGLAVGEGGVILKTEDGGQNWNISFAGTGDNGGSGSGSGSGGDVELLSVQITNSSTAYTCGKDGLFMKSEDAGETWEVQPADIDADIEALHFSTPNTGYVVYELGKVKKTFGNGTFLSVYATTSKDLKDVCFVSNSKGWVVGNEGRILYTTNGGTDWMNQTYTTITKDLYCVHFPSNNVGYIGGKDGTFLRLGNATQVSVDEYSGNLTEPVVYPNPFSDEVVISLSENIKNLHGLSARIMDLSGKTVAMQSIKTGQNVVRFETQELASGIYYLQLLSTENILGTTKIIKQ